MNFEEKIQLAIYAIKKDFDIEQLSWSDSMYGKREFTDEVWKYVEECREIGTIMFNNKYNVNV